MVRRQSEALLYTIPVAACALLALGTKIHTLDNYAATVLANILYLVVTAAACVRTAVGLKQASGVGNRSLPSFIAITSYKALVFCLFCVSAASGAKLLLNGDGRIAFAIGLAFPALATICSLLAVIVFAAASLVVSQIPPLRKTTKIMQGRAKATRIANVIVLCTGIALAGAACAIS